MKLIAAALLILSLPVLADTPPPPASANMVVLPRQAVADVLTTLQAIATLHPDLATAPVSNAFTRLTVCLQANSGPTVPAGQCPEVTAVIEAAKVPAKPEPKDKPAKKRP